MGNGASAQGPRLLGANARGKGQISLLDLILHLTCSRSLCLPKVRQTASGETQKFGWINFNLTLTRDFVDNHVV
jgi:hypothetical protein